MEWIIGEVDADNAIWVASVRVQDAASAQNDPFFGWRLRVRLPLHPEPHSYQEILNQYYRPEHYGKLTPTFHLRSHAEKIDHVGMTGRASLAEAGKFRAYSLRSGEWIDFDAFRKTTHYKLYFQIPGILDRMTIGVPVSDRCESFFMIDRYKRRGKSPKRIFTREETDLAGFASRSVPELHRRLLLGNGLLASDKLFSPAEQRILSLLLDGWSEKEIADAMGHKAPTTHKYVMSIYSRFGVKSRASLMSLWLNGSSRESLPQTHRPGQISGEAPSV
ncbi:MAG: hypothetical protein BGO12_16185 [Verrucomicrobia bacterium 61-8]|nr:helix-turn-helix transcriptional regulator [Verrucomicrobiota bacterium]OJU98783.1 MAG: hypothetical protein BGO12_16185 [Verrucomicrobia bacterium 61-8]